MCSPPSQTRNTSSASAKRQRAPCARTPATPITCLHLQHASEAYHNYHQWLSRWVDFAASDNATRTGGARPPGTALYTDNTTVTAAWIERDVTDVKGWYDRTGWIVNNVTMAVPHVGVIAAAVDPANGILQPDELGDQGIYEIRAALPATFINVLCTMGLSESHLEPLVRPSRNVSRAARDTRDGIGGDLDDLFRWGPRWGDYNWPPTFPKLPKPYNSIVNGSTDAPTYGRDAIYIVAQAADANYGLCQLRVGQTPHCSAQYNASRDAASLEAICVDSIDPAALLFLGTRCANWERHAE